MYVQSIANWFTRVDVWRFGYPERAAYETHNGRRTVYTFPVLADSKKLHAISAVTLSQWGK